jgi:hypothetical protein
MQHVLVHIDKGLGPIGAWSYNDGALVHFYPESLDVQIPARARQAMADRDLTISVPDWFAFITGHYTNALDEFETIAIDKPLSLPTILAEFRRTWSADAETP